MFTYYLEDIILYFPGVDVSLFQIEFNLDEAISASRHMARITFKKDLAVSECMNDARKSTEW